MDCNLANLTDLELSNLEVDIRNEKERRQKIKKFESAAQDIEKYGFCITEEFDHDLAEKYSYYEQLSLSILVSSDTRSKYDDDIDSSMVFDKYREPSSFELPYFDYIVNRFPNPINVETNGKWQCNGRGEPYHAPGLAMFNVYFKLDKNRNQFGIDLECEVDTFVYHDSEGKCILYFYDSRNKKIINDNVFKIKEIIFDSKSGDYTVPNYQNDKYLKFKDLIYQTHNEEYNIEIDEFWNKFIPISPN